MKIPILLIIVLFVVSVKGQLYEFINGCNVPDNFDAKETLNYINSTRVEYNFYLNDNDLSFDFIRLPLPQKAGIFIISVSVFDNIDYRKDPLSLEFNTLSSKSVIHATFSRYQFSNYNGWTFLDSDYYYNYYGTTLEISYLLCDSYKVLKTFYFHLAVGYPLSLIDNYKLVAKLIDR